MPEDPKNDDDKKELDLSKERTKEIFEHIPGIGPKTVQKLFDEDYNTVDSLAEAEAEAMAEAVSGISISKAEEVITEARKLRKVLRRKGSLDLRARARARRARRRRAQEPDPETVGMPPAEELEAEMERTSLVTGLDKEKDELGIHIGPKWLTRFEKARIVGARALQISMGAPMLVDTSEAASELFAIAETELTSGALPMTVRRTLPTGEYKDIPLSVLLRNTRLD
ncbi:DNA-directed RNA polymerase subunit K [Candidatus Thorarchaeota archaeon]|nr:MAG: DNA-directed RNA polymerase subunit K [Candidatus Thorarchaeota archaeon]